MTPALREGVTLDSLGPRLSSCLPPEQREAHYDAIAGTYDVLVRSRLYNRLIWGVSRDLYRAFIGEALAAAGDGLLLDAGCGSAVLSAPAYRAHPVDAVLLDLSLGMLKRAERRVPEGPDLVQGDLYDLPFADGSVDAVLHFGIAHVLKDPPAAFAQLARVVKPGGTVHVGCLVQSGRTCGDLWLRMLQVAGEVAPARPPEQVVGWLEAHGEVRSRVEGSWLLATLRTPRAAGSVTTGASRGAR